LPPATSPATPYGAVLPPWEPGSALVLGFAQTRLRIVKRAAIGALDPRAQGPYPVRLEDRDGAPIPSRGIDPASGRARLRRWRRPARRARGRRAGTGLFPSTARTPVRRSRPAPSRRDHEVGAGAEIFRPVPAPGVRG